MKNRDERLRRLMNRQDVIDEYRSSVACQTLKRLKTFELTLGVFRKNYEEWENAIHSQEPSNPFEAIRMMSQTGWVEDFLVEITRTFHNFVASAFTLVENTRKFYRELYEPDDKMPMYQQEIERRFVSDELSQFIDNMRQYCQHKRLPLMSVQLGIRLTPQGSETNWGVPLRKRELLDFNWNARARRFVEAGGRSIDLWDVTRQYRDKVNEFHEWFSDQQRQIHHEEYEYAERVARRLQELSGGGSAVIDSDIEPDHAATIASKVRKEIQ